MEKERKKKKIEDEEYFKDDTLTEYIVKEGIEEIGEYAFYNCFNLETISFSPGIRKIGEAAFFYCRKIEEIILKEGLEEIGFGAFGGCYRLKHVTLVKGIRKIGEMAFADSALTHFEMNEGLEEVGYGIFQKCENLKTISFPLHKIKDMHKRALRSASGASPPLPLETLILRRPVSSLPSVSIPFPRITDEDNGQLVRFIDTEQEKLFRLELSHLFFVCFALKCAQNGLYNAYGGPVLARSFRYTSMFRGARLRFPVRRDIPCRPLSVADEIDDEEGTGEGGG
eukprot:g1603.t1